MYGPEYLDWKSETAAASVIDRFLAAMEPEDRKWALAVLRERFEVRVEYRDAGFNALQAAASRQNWHTNQHSDISVLVDRERRRASGGPLAFFGL